MEVESDDDANDPVRDHDVAGHLPACDAVPHHQSPGGLHVHCLHPVPVRLVRSVLRSELRQAEVQESIRIVRIRGP